jgi:hypothetical protein
MFKKWEGSSSKDYITRTNDTYNVQIDAAKGGTIDRASSDSSSVATEKDSGRSN